MSLLDTYLGVGAASGIAGMITGGINTGLQFANRKDQLDLQRQAWSREDTAVQRRAADLQAAGLSKTLAAGSGASTMAPIRLEPAQISKDITDAPMRALQASQGVLELMRQKADIAKTAADTRFTEIQAQKAQVETDFMKSTNPIRFDTMSLDLYKNKATVENAIKNVQLDVDAKGIAVKTAELNKELVQFSVESIDWQRVMQKLQESSAFNNVSQQNLELYAKEIALDQAKVNLEDSQRNLNLWKSTGLPSGFNMNGLNSLTGLGINLRTMFPFLDKHLIGGKK